MSGPIRALIVDDEPPARAEVRRVLATQPDVEVVGECANGAQAIQRIREDPPDVVFLDIQMPEVTGFGVLQAVGAHAMPLVVFITAYEEHALRAFEAHALDYLLKPYDEARLLAALDRVRARLRGPERRDDDVRLQALEAFLRQAPRGSYPEVFAIRAGERYQVVRVDDIRWIEAEGSYVRLHLDAGDRLMRQSISEMEQTLLDPARFIRIHRGAIVNLSRIVAVEPLGRSEYSVVLDDGAQVTCSRGYRNQLRERVFFSG
ncbi:MAG TPA: LytTR family DNA-binding domain-containing protein [Longimicrobium sp.]|nr:LytTR family DNA-binding domain-containing protein [Longimicrobium sp.]